MQLQCTYNWYSEAFTTFWVLSITLLVKIETSDGTISFSNFILSLQANVNVGNEQLG